MKRYGILIVAAILVVATLMVLKKPGSSGNGDTFSGGPLSHGRGVEINDRISAGPRRTNQSSTERKKLNALIDQWNSLPHPVRDERSNFHELSADHLSLINEAAEAFPCTEELVEFQKFLNSKGYSLGVDPVLEAVERIFLSEKSEAARSNLLELIKSDERSNDGIYHSWIVLAGRSCKREQIEEFCSSIGYNDLKFDALGGFNSVLAETAPSEALSSSLRQLKETGGSPGVQPLISNLIRHLTPDSNFEELEEMFPADDPKQERSLIRGQFFSKWAESDPAAVANYIMEYPDRLSPAYLRRVSEAVMRKDVNSAVEWVRTFPSGQYYDQAAGGIAVALTERNEELALELAGKIQDQQIREGCISEINRLSEVYKNRKIAR